MAKKKKAHNPAEIATMLDAAIDAGENLAPVIAKIEAEMDVANVKAPEKKIK